MHVEYYIYWLCRKMKFRYFLTTSLVLFSHTTTPEVLEYCTRQGVMVKQLLIPDLDLSLLVKEEGYKVSFNQVHGFIT
jgi:hypothetical protein